MTLLIDWHLIVHCIPEILDTYFTGSDVIDTQRKNIRYKRDAWYQRHKVGANRLVIYNRN